MLISILYISIYYNSEAPQPNFDNLQKKSYLYEAIL